MAHTSARIGDAADTFERGCISHFNETAKRLGCAEGQRCRAAAEAMGQGLVYEGDVPGYEEAHHALAAGLGCRIRSEKGRNGSRALR